MALDKSWEGYSLDFSKEDYPELYRLAEEASQGGVHPAQVDGGVIFDQENPDDKKITPRELLDFFDGEVKGGEKQHDRAMRLIHRAGIPLANNVWTRQDGLSKSMADRHNTAATRLVRAGAKAADIEKHLISVTHFEPDKAAHQINLGNFYRVNKDYAKALQAYRGAYAAWERQKFENREYRWDIVFLQGESQFGLGDFKAARASYTGYLAEFPKDIDVRKLRLEADQYLLDSQGPDAPGAPSLRSEMDLDAALVLASDPATEEATIAAMEARLADDSLTAGEKAEILGTMDGMAREYLRLAGGPFETSSEAERVRTALNALAERCFSNLARAAAVSPDSAFQAREPFYRAYTFLAAGKAEEAVSIFRGIQEKGLQSLETACTDDPSVAFVLRGNALTRFWDIKKRGEQLLATGKVEEAQKVLAELPDGLLEAHAIVSAYDQDLLVGSNLEGLKVWEAFLEDGYNKATKTLKGQFYSALAGDFDGSGNEKEYQREKRIIARVKDKLVAGEALTSWEALEQLNGDASVPEDERKRIAQIISRDLAGQEGNILDGLLHYTLSLHSDEHLESTLLHDAFILESREGVVQSPYAVYALVARLSKNEENVRSAEEEMKALEKGGGFGRGVMKFVYSTSAEELAFDVVTGRVAFRAARLAQKAFLLRTGSVWGARAVMVGTAVTVSFLGTTLKEAYQGDPEKIFSAEHLAKSYGAHLLMMGTTLGFSGLASRVAPGIARGLGMVTKGGTELSVWGERFVWGSSHVFGFGGVVASTQASMLTGLRPRVSFGESMAMDLMNYGIMSRADRLADTPLFGGKGAVSGQAALHAEIRALEAKPHAEKWARSSFGRKWDRMPRDRRERLVAGRADYLAQAALSRPGFSEKTFVAHVEKGDFASANAYLKKFGLKPLFSPHQEMGIQPPRDAGISKPTLLDRLFNPDYDLFGNRRSRWRLEAGAVRIGGDGPPPVRDFEYAAAKDGNPSLVVDGREATFLGKGQNGDVFVHPWDSNYVIKFFRDPGNNKIGAERAGLQNLSDLGISPRPVADGPVGPDGQGYLIMERIQGWTVEELVAARNEGRLTLEQMAALNAAPESLSRLIDRMAANRLDCWDFNGWNVMIGRTVGDRSFRAYLVDAGQVKATDLSPAELRRGYRDSFSDFLRDAPQADQTGVYKRAARENVDADRQVGPPVPIKAAPPPPSPEDAAIRLTETFLTGPAQKVRSDVTLTDAGIRIYVETPEAAQSFLEVIRSGYKTVDGDTQPFPDTTVVRVEQDGVSVVVEIKVDPARNVFQNPEGPKARLGAEDGSVNTGLGIQEAFNFLQPYMALPDVAAVSLGEGRVVLKSEQARTDLLSDLQGRAERRGMRLEKQAGGDHDYRVVTYVGPAGNRKRVEFFLRLDVEPSTP